MASYTIKDIYFYNEPYYVDGFSKPYDDRIYLQLYSSGSYFTVPTFGQKMYISFQYTREIFTNYQLVSRQRIYLNIYTPTPIRGKTITKLDLYVYTRSGYHEKIYATEEYSNDKSNAKDVSAGWQKFEINIDPYVGDKGIYLDQLSDNFNPASNQPYGFSISTGQGQWLEIDSNEGVNKPYAVVEYTDTPPRVPGITYPSNTNIDARKPARLSWTFRYYDNPTQTEYELQYSIDNKASWVTVSEESSNKYHDFDVGTFPLDETIYWRVRVKDGNGLWSEYANAKFTTNVIPPQEPILISPLTGYLDGLTDILLAWEFVGGTAEDTQAKFDIEYSQDRGSTWQTITEISTETSYLAEPYTFQSGNVYWRVRTYNDYGDVSPYSEIGTFFVISSPPVPQIRDTTNSGKPKVTWISTEQQIYELEIYKNDELIYTSGSITSGAREHQLQTYLNDGDYVAKLRITNQYNLKSSWAELEFTISTVKPPEPIIEVYGGEYSVTIKTNNPMARNLVYRDGILIGQVKDNTFIDYTGENKKEYIYFVRTVDFNDNFNDSDVKVAKCKFTDNTIALAGNPSDFIKLKYGMDSIPRKTNNFSVSGNLQYYDGREYPIAEYAPFKSKSKTLAFTLKDKKDVDKLKDFIRAGKTLLFRDGDGENIYGNIFEVDDNKNILGYYEIGFTITMTEYEGGVYD